MISLKSKQTGFTIVELLIVIIVIVILATLVLVTFNGVQQKNRNIERSRDVKEISNNLEMYNLRKSFYPTSTQLTSKDGSVATFVSNDLKGLDQESLRDPKGKNFYLNAGNATSSQYGYVPRPSGCDNTAGNECTSFVLTYLPEGSSLQTVNSLLN